MAGGGGGRMFRAHLLDEVDEAHGDEAAEHRLEEDDDDDRLHGGAPVAEKEPVALLHEPLRAGLALGKDGASGARAALQRVSGLTVTSSIRLWNILSVKSWYSVGNSTVPVELAK